MAKKKNGALTKRGETALTNWREQMKSEAIDVAAREILVAPRVSFKGGAIAGRTCPSTPPGSVTNFR
jgi:hypothetical protein